LAKTKTIENLFVLLAIYSDLLPILLFVFFFRSIKSKRFIWIITAFTIFDFITNLSLYHFIPPNYHNYIYPVFTIFESLFFSIFFYNIVSKSRTKRIILLISAIFLFSLIAYYYYTYFIIKQFSVLDSIPIGIETILFFIFSFFYFYEQLNHTTNLFIYNEASFWGVLAILLYLAASFFIYIFANQISIQELNKYWIITNIGVILRNIFFTVAIYIQANESIKKPPKNYNFYPSN
jgi:hypothetical protein